MIDIGSNSIRLVVFDALSRAPRPIFNEKVMCGLGRDLERTGRLHPQGAELAIANLRRFGALAKAMGVSDLKVLATAAVRDASNGAEFAATVRKHAGLTLRTVGGAEEARLSALGVVCGIPAADGMMGDLGGGSLEIVALDHGKLRQHATLPFGPLRLKQAAEKGRKALRDFIDERLRRLGWLDLIAGRDFHAVGGAWRTLARIHMAQTNYPLRVIHHYTIPTRRAVDFLDLVAGMSRASLERVEGASRRRHEALPAAALVLERLLLLARPAQLVFSSLGLREGCMYAELSAARRGDDPLIDGCLHLAGQGSRFAVDASTLAVWIEPLLVDVSGAEAAELRRLAFAACVLSDIAWGEHPDYRAEIAFVRVLRAQFVGIDHPGRAFLATTVLSRYAGDAESELVRNATGKLLDRERAKLAVVLGRGLRLAYAFAGGTTGVLRRVSLRLDKGAVRLVVPRSAAPFLGESVTRRLDQLAAFLDRKPMIDSGGS